MIDNAAANKDYKGNIIVSHRMRLGQLSVLSLTILICTGWPSLEVLVF